MELFSFQVRYITLPKHLQSNSIKKVVNFNIKYPIICSIDDILQYDGIQNDYKINFLSET